MTIGIPILISLDDILDTRLGTIDILSPVASFKLLHEKKYLNRVNDNWEKLTEGLITNQQFKERYAARDLETLKHSKMTANAVWLKEFTVMAENEWVKEPTMGLPVVHVNLWPYVNVPDATLQSIKLAITQQCLGNMTGIAFVTYPPQAITPQLLHEHYKYFFIYELEVWKEMQRDNFMMRKIPDVVIHAPKLYLDEPPSKEDLLIDDEHPVCPFRAAELMMFEYMHLSFFPVDYWGIVLP